MVVTYQQARAAAKWPPIYCLACKNVILCTLFKAYEGHAQPVGTGFCCLVSFADFAALYGEG